MVKVRIVTITRVKVRILTFTWVIVRILTITRVIVRILTITWVRVRILTFTRVIVIILTFTREGGTHWELPPFFVKANLVVVDNSTWARDPAWEKGTCIILLWMLNC